MSEKQGLYRMLGSTTLYEWSQQIIYRKSAPDTLRKVAYPALGTPALRVLDIGCGPAAFYGRYQASVDLNYLGIEPNPKYVATAQKRFPQISLICGTVLDVDINSLGQFGLVVLEGVLHHLADEEVRQVLEFGSQVLVPGGHLVTVDPVLLSNQRKIARWLAVRDRGRYVRTPDAYRRLFEAAAPQMSFTSTILSSLLRVPYDQMLCQLR